MTMQYVLSIAIIAIVVFVFILSKNRKWKEEKSELHAKDRYSVFNDDEHLTIFM